MNKAFLRFKNLKKIYRNELKMQSKIFSLSALIYMLDSMLPNIVIYTSIAIFINITSIPMIPRNMVFIMGYSRKISELIGVYFVRAIITSLNANVSVQRVQV